MMGDTQGTVYKLDNSGAAPTSKIVCASKTVTAVAYIGSGNLGVAACSTASAMATNDRSVYKVDFTGSATLLGTATQYHVARMVVDNDQGNVVMIQAYGRISYVSTSTWGALTTTQISGSLTDDAKSVDFASGSNVVACYSTGKVLVVNYKTGAIVYTLTAHTGAANDCAYVVNFGSGVYISAGDDKQIIVSTAAGVLETKKTLLDSWKPVLLRPLTGFSNGLVMVGGDNKKVYVFDVQINNLLAAPVYDVTQTGATTMLGLEQLASNNFAVILGTVKALYHYCTIYSKFDGTNKCICQDGYYKEATSNNCLKCPFKSNKCSTATTFTQCRGDRSLPDCTCPDMKFDDGVSLNCASCLSSCATCVDGQSCATCSANTVEKLCTTCAVGLFKSSATKCSACGSKLCKTCIAATSCVSCADSNHLPPDCLTCVAGMFPSGTSCLTCAAPCATCSSALACDTCSDANKQLPDCLDCAVGFY